MSVDQILLRLEKKGVEPGFVDPRHCLVVWGRPTGKVKSLIERVQKEIASVVPGTFSVFENHMGLSTNYINHSFQ